MALPPNWTRYTTDDGKDYFHNAAEGKTQWEPPEWPSGSGLASTADVYKPSSADLEHQERPSSSSGHMVTMDSRAAFAGTAATEKDTVPLRSAPGGGGGGGGGAGGGGGVGGGLFAGLGPAIASGVLASAATSEAADGESQAAGMYGRLLAQAQELFDVNTDEVVQRVRGALLPYPPPIAGAPSDLRAKPDFWGPFWIATTAVLFLAATGNFARLLESGDHTTFKANYGLVSLGASMVYGCLVMVPAAIRLAVYCGGIDANSVDLKHLICVYGYSLTSTIPVSILCIIPVNFLRWLAVLAGLAVSLTFIRGNIMWSDIAVEAPQLKWGMVCLISGSLVAIYTVYKVHFFKDFGSS